MLKTTAYTPKISEADGKLRVQSDYHPDFVASAKNLGGKWSDPCWVFDARNRPRVEALCREVYGTAGEDIPRCEVRYRLPDGYSRAVYQFGRLMVSRTSRDYRVRLGDGVIVEAGGFPASGGSVKNPSIACERGTILVVQDAALSLARECVEADPETYEIISTTEQPASPDAETLESNGLEDITTETLLTEIRRRGFTVS